MKVVVNCIYQLQDIISSDEHTAIRPIETDVLQQQTRNSETNRHKFYALTIHSVAVQIACRLESAL